MKLNPKELEPVALMLASYEANLQRLNDFPLPVKVEITPKVAESVRIPLALELQFARLEAAKFQIEVPVLLAIIGGWTKFYAWLKENYTNKDGKIKFRFWQFPKVAGRAIQYIILDVYVAWKASQSVA